MKTLKAGASGKSGETEETMGWKKWGKGTFRIVEDGPDKHRLTFTQYADANTTRPKEWLNAHNESWVDAKPHASRDTMVQFDCNDFAMVLDSSKKETGQVFRYLLRFKTKTIADSVVAAMKKYRAS